MKPFCAYVRCPLHEIMVPDNTYRIDLNQSTDSLISSKAVNRERVVIEGKPFYFCEACAEDESLLVALANSKLLSE